MPRIVDDILIGGGRVFADNQEIGYLQGEFSLQESGDALTIKESEGATVLLVRYVYSNVAYQCAKLSDPDEAEALRTWILETEYGPFDLPRPDLNLFLDVPLGFVEHSLSASRSGAERDYLEGGSDIHEADLTLQRRVRDMYRRQATLDPSFIVVDCSDGQGRMLPPDAIFAKIKDVVDKTLEDA